MTQTDTAGENRGAGGGRLLRLAALVFVLSLVIRVTWAYFARVTPISDFQSYDELALNWLHRGHFSSLGSMAYRTPGYPGFLAIIYSIVGHSWRVVGFVQAALGALTSGLLVLLAGKVLSRRGAVIAGVLHAVSPTALAYVPVLASETLAAFLLVAGLLSLAAAQERVSVPRYLLTALSGALLALVLLVRPAGSFIVPAFVVLAAYSRTRRTWRARPALVFLVAMLLALSPWFIRNREAGLGPLTLSTAGGENLLMGNNDKARLGGFQEGVVERGPFTERAQDRAYRKAALAWIRSHSGRYVVLSVIRANRLLGFEPDTWAAKYLVPTRENDRAFTASYLHSWEGASSEPPALLARAGRVETDNAALLRELRMLLAPLVLLALVLSCLRWRRYALILLPALTYLAGLSLTYVEIRFRELADPLLFIPLAGLVGDVFFSTSDILPSSWRQSRAFVSARATAKAILADLWKPESPEASSPAGLPVEPGMEARDRELGEGEFSPIDLTEDGVCTYQSGVQSLRVARVGDGLGCEIVAARGGAAPGIGGIIVRATAPGALRLRFSFLEPGNVRGFRIAGCDLAERCCFAWYRRMQGEEPLSGPHTCVLVPGEASGGFLPEDVAGLGEAKTIRLLLEVAPQAGAGFVLHEIGMGAPPLETSVRPIMSRTHTED